MNIQITDGRNILPHISPSATPTEIEAVANSVYAELMRSIVWARAALTNLNECLPVKKVDIADIDDLAAAASDIADEIEARADMVREAREGDR